MRAIVYEQFQGPITIQKVLDPTPKDHGVVVKITATGLCRSDWHGWIVITSYSIHYTKLYECQLLPKHEISLQLGKDV